MKKIAIAVMLAVLLLLAMPVAVSAAGVTVTNKTGDGVWVGDVWQVEIYPGETKSTTLTLYNSSNSMLGVEMTVIPDSLDNGNLTFGLDNSTFTMGGWSYIDVTLSVKASGSATPGTYTTELGIKSDVAPEYVVTPTPTPPVLEPAPEEPTEPEEPEVVEPEEEEPEVVEPEEEEPEVVEPEEEEPEVIEPEVIEPGEEEEEVIVPAKPGAPWGLIGGLVGGLAAAGGIGWWLWLWRRRRKETNYGS